MPPPEPPEELIEQVAWSLEYKDYFDNLNEAARRQSEEKELSPEEEQQMMEVQETRLKEIFERQISKVNLSIEGNVRTRTDFLVNEFDFNGVDTIKDACVRAQQGVTEIESFGIMDEVNIVIDEGDEGPGALDVTVAVQEKTSVGSVELGAEHNTHEISGNLGWKFKNVLGGAESLTLSARMGAQPNQGLRAGFLGGSSHHLNAVFHKPRAFDSKADLHARVYQDNRNYVHVGSFMEQAMGGEVTYTDESKEHMLTYNLEFRGTQPKKRDESNLFNLDKETREEYTGPSASIIAEGAQPNLKSCLRYQFTRDRRDNPVIPTEGHMCRLNAEFAGLGGDAQFIKAQGAASYHWPLPNRDFGTLNIGLRTGMITPLGLLLPSLFSDQRTRVTDRVPVGGALLSRGYTQGCCGPRDGFDFLNADLSYSAGLSWTKRFPSTGLFSNVFVGASGGALRRELRQDEGLLSAALSQPRVSAGASCVIPLGPGRLEIGIAHRLGFDNPDPFYTLYWGFGVDFL